VLHYLREALAGSFAADENVDLADSTRLAELRARFSDDAFASTGEIDPKRCERLLRCRLSVIR
jgi:hypothetical protein